MKKKWITASILTGALLTASIPTLPIIADTVKELEDKIENEDIKTTELEEKKEQMEQALSTLNSDLYKLSMEMNQTSAELEESFRNYQQSTQELAEAQTLAEQHYEGMKRRIQFFYENGNLDAFTCYLRSKNTIDFINNVSMISDFTAYDRKKLAEYEETLEIISQKKELLEIQQADLNEKQEEFIQQQEKLVEKIAKQKDKLKHTREDLEEQKIISTKLQNQLQQMIAYETALRAQENPLEDSYYQLATANGYTNGYHTINYSGAINYTQQELDIFAALIYCEGGGESYEFQLAVASTVMNRLRSPLFPDTLLGVIYQHKQFTPVLTGRHAVVLEKGLATESCRNAALFALNGNTTGNWLFFRIDKENRINGTRMGVSVFY